MADKAILIAAGMGRRLGPYTEDRPKCLVEVAGRKMVHRALDALRSIGVKQFIIIHGYLGERLMAALANEPDVTFIANPDYTRNNILLSLMCAEAAMEGGFFCSYSDIVYRPEVALALSKSRHDVSLVVDPFFAESYKGRSEHPIAEAELCSCRPSGDGLLVGRVGKQAVPMAEAFGEFIGLFRVSADGARWLRSLYRRRLAELGLEKPYGRAPRFEVAYLTDLFNDLIDEGHPVHAVQIAHPRSWREIDTVQDLERAAHVIDW